MSETAKKLFNTKYLFGMEPVGCAVRLFIRAINPHNFKHISFHEFKDHCKWMGPGQFHLVAISSLLISIALTIQCVIELHKYQAEDISGMAISIGLLREMGPLTISVAWCAIVSARISEVARNTYKNYSSDRDFAEKFVPVRLLAALAVSVPLGGYGLAIGFVTAALYSPTIGVNSAMDFAESARVAITDLDVTVYFVKLIAVNPVIAVIIGASCGIKEPDLSAPVSAKAVSMTVLGCYLFNLAVTVSAFLDGRPGL